jgi:hypothetical protein
MNIEKPIKKSIVRGIKYLRKYRLKIIEHETKKGNVYDGGATILLSYLQSQYGIDFDFDNNCGSLVKCAQIYSINHHKPIFNFEEQHTDLFETNFLRDIYLQKYTKYTIKGIIQKMEQYLQSGGNIINHIMPLLGFSNQREMRYTNVALGLVGLIEKNPEKIINNKYYLHLKKRVARELADIFNKKEIETNISMTKSYSLFLLHLLDEEKRIDEEMHNQFIVSLIKSQNSGGEWTYSDITNDKINEINNTILTIFSVVNLLNKLKNELLIDEEEEENENNNSKEENENNIDDNNKEMIEGFSYAGGVLTEDNYDNIFKGENKKCIGSIIEVSLLLCMIAGTVYALLHLYRKKTGN